MPELPWVTIFGSRERRFASDFHKWRFFCITSDPKPVIRRNEGNIFLYAIFCLNTEYL